MDESLNVNKAAGAPSALNVELERDAMRYRHIREWLTLIVCNANTEDEYTEIAFGENGPTDLIGTFDGIDAAIDADMAQSNML